MKLTEILQRGTFLNACYDFKVYFFKIFVSHVFLGKFCLKIWNSPNWLKFGTRVHGCMLTTILMFIFLKFFWFIFFWANLVRKIWCYLKWLESSICIHLHSSSPLGGSRAAVTSKMERFVIIVNVFQPLTVITKHSILDVTAALDPPLVHCNLKMLSVWKETSFYRKKNMSKL